MKKELWRCGRCRLDAGKEKSAHGRLCKEYVISLLQVEPKFSTFGGRVLTEVVH